MGYEGGGFLGHPGPRVRTRGTRILRVRAKNGVRDWCGVEECWVPFSYEL